MAASPEPSYRFALVGEVLEPRAGVVAVDVGGKCVPGVIDHHFVGAGPDCSAVRVARHGEALVLGHLSEAPGAGPTILMHREPDLDCLVSAFLARALILDGEIPPGGPALAEYAQAIDAGLPPPDGLGPSSLWALYLTTTRTLRPVLAGDDPRRFSRWVERGFELLERALATAPEEADAVALPRRLPGFEREQEILSHAYERYQDDRRRAEAFTITLPVPGGTSRDVAGVRIEAPSSALFKHFARAEGTLFTHIVYPRGDEVGDGGVSPHRHVISATPERRIWLRGLGKALERQEVLARAGAGRPRPGPPRWSDVTNSDPWYDGRSSLHSYTIVDTPRGGTLLALEEVVRIVGDSDRWIELGRAPTERRCPKGCRLPADDDACYCPRHGVKLVPAVVDGHYEVIRWLGSGGMAVVYEVRHRRTGRSYALKHLLPTYAEDEEAWKVFLREARLANRVGHPNVVRLVDTGADPTAGLYTVSELVDGVTLEQDLRAHLEGDEGRYPWRRLCSVLEQVCDALTAVHGAGVLHRDLKPGNIMLVGERAGGASGSPRVKVLDFGVAILSDPRASRLTSPGLFHGTPHYAAPEQLFDGEQDERTDLYALGTILYELLCGRLPFGDRASVVSMSLAKCAEGPPPLPCRRPELAREPGVEALLFRLLEVDPARRPAAAATVRDEIARWQGQG